jgi:hypothetical protein
LDSKEKLKTLADKLFEEPQKKAKKGCCSSSAVPVPYNVYVSLMKFDMRLGCSGFIELLNGIAQAGEK